MINFVTSHGSQLAIASSLLNFVEYAPNDKKGEVITLHFATHTVKLLGLRLGAVYRAIREQRVCSIVAIDPLQAPDGAVPLVTGIHPIPRAGSSERAGGP